MKAKHFFPVAVFLLSSVVAAFSQIQTFPPVERNKKPLTAPNLDYGGSRIVLPNFFKVGDVTGSIGGAKAVTLVKPAYPEEARVAGAEGKIRVAVEIDETGTVTSAKAVSGDPLLFEAAQKAALQSKFLTPKAGDARTKVTGFLNYNFTIEKPNWFAVVFGLFPNNFGVTPAVAKKALAADWTEERELIDKLGEIFLKEPKLAPPKLEVFSVEKPVGGMSGSMRGTGRILPPAPNQEGIEIGQKLINLIRNRLADQPAALWQFELNFDVAQAANLYRREFQRQESIALLRQKAQSAPPDVPPAMLAELQKLIAILEKAAQSKKTDRSFESGSLWREFNISMGMIAAAN